MRPASVSIALLAVACSGSGGGTTGAGTGSTTSSSGGAPCALKQQNCASLACCSGSCTSSICTCTEMAGSCQSNATCCSGNCVGGFCLACVAVGQPCAANANCCSGVCLGGACANMPVGSGNGSCSVASSVSVGFATCVDYVGTTFAGSQGSSQCATSMGTFSTQSCVGTGALGKCTLHGGTPQEVDTYFFATGNNYTAMDAQNTCTGGGGTWTPGA